MIRVQLEQIDGPLRFVLEPGRALVLGRSPGCDLVVADPAVSRRHARVEASEAGLEVLDLGSANGTRINGGAVSTGRAGDDDVVTFGAARFRVGVRRLPELTDALPEGTTLRPLTGLLPTEGRPRESQALERLLALAAGLAGDPEPASVLDGIAALSFDVVDADRVAILLADGPDAPLRVAAYRNRQGDAAPLVPRAIAERAVAEGAPVVTDHAGDDPRFESRSVHWQAVRSAVCVPLAADGRVLGALYADTITRPTPFGDDEARALHAFAGLAGVTLARARAAEEARRERERRGHLERYFAPAVADAIAAGPPTALAGARREVAVLFADLRGFSALAAKLGPEETAALLGAYFGVMVDVVFEEGGTLDKFVGDAVMAVWGAPLPCPDAADRAARAAQTILAELETLNARRRAESRPTVEAGVGLAYGEVFAGNIGSARRLEYTVVGDAANLAARLSDAAGPGEVLASAALVDRMAECPRALPVQLPGLHGPGPAVIYRLD